MSFQTLKVLEAFLENPSEEFSGADVHKRSGIASGTLYPSCFDSSPQGGLSAVGKRSIRRVSVGHGVGSIA